MIPSRIALVGSGNVASHLGRALGNRIGIVVSRNPGMRKLLQSRHVYPKAEAMKIYGLTA